MGEIEAVRVDDEPVVEVLDSPYEPAPTLDQLRDAALAARVYPLVAKMALSLATQEQIDAEYAAILAEYPE